MSRLWKRRLWDGRLVALESFSINCTNVVKGQIGAYIPKTAELPPNDTSFWIDSSSTVEEHAKFHGNCLVVGSDIGRRCELTHTFIRNSSVKQDSKILCSRITGTDIEASCIIRDCTLIMSKPAMYTESGRGDIGHGCEMYEVKISTTKEVNIGSGVVMKTCVLENGVVLVGSRSTLEYVRCSESFRCENCMHIAHVSNNYYSSEIVSSLYLTKENTVTVYASKEHPITVINTDDNGIISFCCRRVEDNDPCERVDSIVNLVSQYFAEKGNKNESA